MRFNNNFNIKEKKRQARESNAKMLTRAYELSNTCDEKDKDFFRYIVYVLETIDRKIG